MKVNATDSEGYKIIFHYAVLVEFIKGGGEITHLCHGTTSSKRVRM